MEIPKYLPVVSMKKSHMLRRNEELWLVARKLPADTHFNYSGKGSNRSDRSLASPLLFCLYTEHRNLYVCPPRLLPNTIGRRGTSVQHQSRVPNLRCFLYSRKTKVLSAGQGPTARSCGAADGEAPKRGRDARGSGGTPRMGRG